MNPFWKIFLRKIISIGVMITLIIPIFVPWKEFSVSSASAENEFFATAIIVEESLLQSALQDKINRYAQDAQLSQHNTKSILIPLPSSASSHEIYQVLESMYHSGYTESNNRFFLNGVVLIGDVPLPRLHDENDTLESVFPYTDFLNPSFLWDTEISEWIENPEYAFPKAEIWHGVIRGTPDQLEHFFDKNHQTHQKLSSGTPFYKDEILFWDSFSERNSSQNIILGQYENRQDLGSERKHFRFNKEFLKTLYQQYSQIDIFNPPELDETRSLFPQDEPLFWDESADFIDFFQGNDFDDSPDIHLKKNIEDILPEYSLVVRGYEKNMQELIESTGRWNTESGKSIPEKITLIDEWVANQIWEINNSSKNQIEKTLSFSDGGVRIVPTGTIQIEEESNIEPLGEYIELDNFLDGTKGFDIINPEQCTLYKGNYRYENLYDSTQYDDWEKNKKDDEFSEDKSLLFTQDPLPNTPGQEVEFNTLYDFSSANSGGNIIQQCDRLGGCCIINQDSPDSCDPDLAIDPVFTWNGSRKIQNQSQIRYDAGFEKSETAGLMCKRFNFNSEPIHLPVFIRKGNASWGSVQYKEIESLIEQVHPSLDIEQSLYNSTKHPLASHIPTQRVRYIDLQTGDDGIETYSEVLLPDFFRHQYKPDLNNPFFTIHELTQISRLHDKYLVGGNSVFNREEQYTSTPGIGNNSGIIRVQRVLEFTDEGVFSSDVFPVPDDFGKKPVDYEVEILESLQGQDQATLFDIMWEYSASYRASRMAMPKNLIKAKILEEISALIPFAWETKALQNIGFLPQARQKQQNANALPYGKKIQPEEYYLGYEINTLQNNSDLNKYLIPQADITKETFKGVEWNLTPLSQESNPSWINTPNDLPKRNGTLFLEVYEILANQNDVFDEYVPIAGRSFLGSRKNAPNDLDFYASVSGNTLRDHSISKQEIRIGGSILGDICPLLPINEYNFFTQNIIEYNDCETIFYIERHEGHSTLPESNTLNLQSLLAKKDDLGFLFAWNGMTSAEKHEMVQNILLDKNTNPLQENTDPYAYIHWNMEGNDTSVWKAPDGSQVFQGIDWESVEDFDFASRLTPDPEIAQNEKCGPIDGVPLWEWIPAIMCWLNDMQNIGIEFVKHCGFDVEDFENPTQFDYESDPHHLSIFSETDPLLMGVENTIYIETLSQEDKRIKRNRGYFTITLEGAEFSSHMADLSSEEPGLQVSDADGLEFIEIIPTAETVNIQVQGQWGEITLDASESFSVLDNQVFSLLQVDQTTQNGVNVYTMKVVANQPMNQFDPEILLSVSPSSEAVLSQNTVKLNEEFLTAVRSDESVLLRASYRGIKKAEVSLSGSLDFASTPDEIFLPELPEYLGFYTTHTTPIMALNALGSVISPPPTPSVIDIQGEGEVKIEEENGLPVIVIETKNTTGPLSFTLDWGTAQKQFSVFVGASTPKEEYMSQNINGIYASFTGLSDPIFSVNDHFGLSLLHSSDELNALTTLITPPFRTEKNILLHPSGNIQIQSRNITPILTSTNPLHLGVFDERSRKYLSQFSIVPPASAQVYLSAPEQSIDSGVFFENHAYTLSNELLLENRIEQNTIEILLDGVLSATVSSAGSIEIFDNALSVELVKNAYQDMILIDLLFEKNTLLGTIAIKGATLSLTSPTPWTSEQDGVFHIIEPEEYRTQKTNTLFGGFHTSFTQNAFGFGFNDESNYALQFADGNSVGESTISSAEIFLINFGDPTIRLLPPEQNASGFSETIGKQLWESESEYIKKTFPLEYDGDGKPDIGMLMSNGEIHVLNQVSHGFREVGKIVHIDKDFLIFGIADLNSDGFDEIIYANKAGKWHVVQNDATKLFIDEETDSFPQESFISGEIHDIDNDGHADIAGITESGKISLWYGTGNGSFTEGSTIDSLSFMLPSSTEESTFLSFEGIETIPELQNILFPLSYTKEAFVSEEILLEPLSALSSSTLPSGNDSANTTSVAQQLFAPAHLFPQSISVQKQMQFATPDQQTLTGKEILFQTTITSTDTQEINISIGDVYPDFVSVSKESLQCQGCNNDTILKKSHSSHALITEPIPLSPGQTITISYRGKITHLPRISLSLASINEDDISDLILRQEKGIVQYLSTSPRTYEKSLPENTQDPNIPDPDFLTNLEDGNANGVPDVYEGDMMDLIGYGDDSDSDGIPDFWDEDLESGDIEKLENALDNAINFLASCNGGGCLNLPINYAFLVPGQPNVIAPVLQNTINTPFPGLNTSLQNITNNINAEITALTDKIGLPSGAQPYVMTVFNKGPASFCIGPSCWIKCTGGNLCPISFQQGFALSTFRFYISPTLTGGMGIGVCTGPGKTTLRPGGMCFFQAVPNDALGQWCQNLTAQIDNAYKSSLGSGDRVFTVESNFLGGDESELGTYSLGTINNSIPTAQNTRTLGGPSWFARWANAQIEEISAMFSLPALTIYYPDISGTFYNATELTEAKESFIDTLKGKKVEDHFKEKISSSQDGENNTENTNLSTKQKLTNGVNSLYNKLGTVNNAIEEISYRAESIDDFYRMLESVPLLRVNRTPISIQYPTLPRTEILNKIRQAENWINHAKKEKEAFLQSWESWDDAMKQQIIQEVDKAIESVENLKNILEFYKNEGPRILSDIDTQLAEYMYSLICYLDAISELTGRWTMRNKIRYYKWLELYDTLPEIIKAFQTIPKIFNGYQSYCETCRASNYNSGSFVVKILGNLLPTPPIIKFPRLPDIVLDVSKINASITVDLPILELTPAPIKLPVVLPVLELPRVPVPSFSLNFPDIPELPRFQVPELPDFPSIPLPVLPDIPPAPKLPSFMADFGGIMKIVEKGLFLYCLIIRKGMFVYPEFTGMSVVETLTSRPIKPLSFDFLALNFPNIVLPSISEIEVSVEVNLEQDLDFISDKAQEFADEINEKTTNFITPPALDIGKFTDKLDQSGAFDKAEQEAQEKTDSITEDINDTLENLEEDAQDSSDTIQQNLDNITDELEEDIENTVSQTPQKIIQTILSPQITKLHNKWENTPYIEASHIRTALGKDPWTPPSPHPHNPYTDLTSEVRSLQNFYHARSKHLASSQDITTVMDLELPIQKVFANDTPTPLSSDAVQEVIQASIPETIIDPLEGVFIQTEAGITVPLSAYKKNHEHIHSFFFDFFGNQEKSLIYATHNSVYIKHKNPSLAPSSYSASPSTVPFAELLSQYHSAQNMTVHTYLNESRISAFPEPKDLMAGMLLSIDTSPLHHTRIFGDPSVFILQLKKEIFDEISQTLPPETDILWTEEYSLQGLTLRDNTLQFPEQSIVRIEKMENKKKELPVEPNRVYSVRGQWITENGSLGSASAHTLLVQKKVNDETPPSLLSGKDQKGYLYTQNTITITDIYERESDNTTISWDSDLNGEYDLTANAYTSPLYRIPTRVHMPVQLVDDSGNTSDQTVVIQYIAPEVALSEAKTTTVSGNIFPRYQNAPISLVRERFGNASIIQSAQPTDTLGEYQFQNFERSPNAVVKDHNGIPIAEFDAKNGKLQSLSPDYSVSLIPADTENPMRQVLIDTQGVIVANAFVEAESVYSIQKVDSFRSDSLSPVQVHDTNPLDSIQIEILPIDMAENHSGAVMFDSSTDTPLAMIYKTGSIAFFPNTSLDIRLKPENNFIIEIFDTQSHSPLAEVFLQLQDERILLDFDRIITGIQHIPSLASQTLLNFSKLLASNGSIPKQSIAQSPFSDLSPNHPQYTDIIELYKNNMITGYSDGTFRPDDTILRGEFVHLALAVTDCLDCLSPSEPEKNSYYQPFSFPDISPNDWFDFCIAKAKRLSMIQGYADGEFKPLQTISRAEAVAILLRQANIPLSSNIVESVGDVPETAWYAKEMMTGIELGLVTPTLGFAFPEEKITRAQFSELAYQLFTVKDCRTIDSDNDGYSDATEEYFGSDKYNSKSTPTENSESIKNPRDEVLTPQPAKHAGEYEGEDLNQNGIQDQKEEEYLKQIDSDNDGISDFFDSDTSGEYGGEDLNQNGIQDQKEEEYLKQIDSDNDGIPDFFDSDTSGKYGGEDLNQNGIQDQKEEEYNNTQENISYPDTPTPSDNNNTQNPSSNPDSESSSNPNTTPNNETDSSTIDFCPNIPEDKDGFQDDDGCPDIYDDTEPPSFLNENGEETKVLVKGDPNRCGFLDYKADIRIGDTIWTAVLSDDETEIYSQSEKNLVQE